jgi:16S rRNA (guanine966-N2)-methyltransferase
MRVVAGSAGGMPLYVPKTDLRPTMDRVKAAIFSSLGEKVPGARVLDLFAGSGGLGIEALSRGSASAVFVEKNALAAETIKRNFTKTHLQGEVQQMDVFSYLDRLAKAAAFDIILADPPYAKAPGERDFGTELLRSESLRSALAPGGVFVLEKLPGAPFPKDMGWECVRLKKYGATEVAFLRSTANDA